MKAVILAGGLGTRLQPFTQVIPKPLLPIGEKSLLEVQIGHLRQYGFDEIYLATNYKSDYIRNFFGDGSRYSVKLEVSEERIPLGTAGPVALLRDRLRAPFLLMNGDILSNVDLGKLYAFGCAVTADLTVGIKGIVTPFAFGRIHHAGDFVTKIEEKPNFEIEVLAGIYLMKPEVLRLIPDHTYFGMDTLITTMLDQSLPVAKYVIREYWLDIGQMPDYQQAQQAYKDHFESHRQPQAK